MQVIHNQLTQLKLSGVKSALEHQNELPSTYQEMSFEERLSLLLDEELTQRENKRIARLLKQARFRLHAELEELEQEAGPDEPMIKTNPTTADLPDVPSTDLPSSRTQEVEADDRASLEAFES